ncbi:hypothetical protein EJB05_14570, partial [Eragrostis curvula]
MEVILSAILSDLAARSVSFLMGRILNRRPEQSDDETQDRLRRLLLRVHVVVEEAEGRRVTSHAMLRQLSALREEMYRGRHALDGAVVGRRRNGCGGDAEVSSRRNSHVAAASGFNPAKRVCLARIRSRSNGGGGGGGEKRRPPSLQQVLGSLEAVFADVKDEFVALLAGCPRLSRRHQPYNAYMFIDKCMFGRQEMEVERVVAFLLQEDDDDDGAPRPGVLPISGPKRAGKSTLVDHACNDESVRGHFSQIVTLSRGNLGDEIFGMTTTITTSCCEERVLLIVELDGDRNTKGLDWDLNEALLGRFLSACKSRTPRVSKIIVTSRSDKVASFGTTDLLRLRPLTEEAFWYFFKARAFGSADASEHPKMVSIAMEMAEEMRGSFAAANFFGGLLRSNFNTGFWSLALAVFRGLKQTKLVVVHDRAQQTATTSTGTEIWEEVTEPACPFAVEGVPKVSLRDVLFGGARPQGKFDVLAWKSPVPPHYRYAYSCEIRSSHSTVARKNRLVMHKTGS